MNTIEIAKLALPGLRERAELNHHKPQEISKVRLEVRSIIRSLRSIQTSSPAQVKVLVSEYSKFEDKLTKGVIDRSTVPMPEVEEITSLLNHVA